MLHTYVLLVTFCKCNILATVTHYLRYNLIVSHIKLLNENNLQHYF